MDEHALCEIASLVRLCGVDAKGKTALECLEVITTVVKELQEYKEYTENYLLELGECD